MTAGSFVPLSLWRGRNALFLILECKQIFSGKKREGSLGCIIHKMSANYSKGNESLNHSGAIHNLWLLCHSIIKLSLCRKVKITSGMNILNTQALSACCSVILRVSERSLPQGCYSSVLHLHIIFLSMNERPNRKMTFYLYGYLFH